jgi:hypothetical protein
VTRKQPTPSESVWHNPSRAETAEALRVRPSRPQSSEPSRTRVAHRTRAALLHARGLGLQASESNPRRAAGGRADAHAIGRVAFNAARRGCARDLRKVRAAPVTVSLGQAVAAAGLK